MSFWRISKSTVQIRSIEREHKQQMDALKAQLTADIVRVRHEQAALLEDLRTDLASKLAIIREKEAEVRPPLT